MQTKNPWELEWLHRWGFQSAKLQWTFGSSSIQCLSRDPKAALDETILRAGLMRISLPMVLATALPRLRSMSWARTEGRKLGCRDGICTCVSKMLTLQLSTRSQLLNTLVNTDSSHVNLCKFPSPGSQLLNSSCSSKKANSCTRVWNRLKGLSISLNIHPAYILILQPPFLLSLVPWYSRERNMHEEGKGNWNHMVKWNNFKDVFQDWYSTFKQKRKKSFFKTKKVPL